MPKEKFRGLMALLLLGFVLLTALPNMLPNSFLPSFLHPQNAPGIELGLDLQGGSYLLLHANTEELIEKHYENLNESLFAEFKERNVRLKTSIDNDGLLIAPYKSADFKSAKGLVTEVLATSSLGYGVKESEGQIRVTLTQISEAQLVSDALDKSVDVVRRRLDESGLVEPSIQRQGDESIVVQMPGVENPSDIKALLGTTAQLNFHWLAVNSSSVQSHAPAVVMAGERIKDAQLAFNQQSGEPVVNFSLDTIGAKQFAQLTQQNIGRPLAIVLDNEVLTAPVIRSAITTGSGEISGQFSTQEASQLALMLRAGALPVELNVVEERTVGPTLGGDSIQSGFASGVFGAALVVAFLLAAYGKWGLVAVANLALSLGVMYSLLSLLGATLTLPGIAGIVLTLGMAVDANILIFERIRENANRKVRGGIRSGFQKAMATIVDSNLTTLIAVSLLFLMGSGPVRGFAVTIGLGIVSTLLVTWVFSQWAINRFFTEFPIKHSTGFSARSVNFILPRMGVLSSVLVMLVVALLGVFGFTFGIDFTGGAQLELAFSGDANLLRQQVSEVLQMPVAVQEFGAHYLASIPSGVDPSILQNSVNQLINQGVEVLRVEMVGGKVSEGFIESGVLAVLLAAAGMLTYLWVRFESHFAWAATLAVAFDVLVTLGYFSLFKLEFNLTAIAALLALIGYSMNDKVVIFDRVRELLREGEGALAEKVNEAILSTFRRTVLTSLTTILALAPMVWLGGAAVQSFAEPMMFGVFIGTLSTMFVAAPMLLKLGLRRERLGLPQLKPLAEEIQAELDRIP